MVDTSIKSQLKQAIQEVSTKSAEVSSGTFASDIAAAKASQAQSIISAKESAVNARQKDFDNVVQQLNPPPTKEVDEGGKRGGTKTVVDQDEVKRLETQKAGLQTQLTQAKAEVADAREEASTSTTDALEKAGISKEQQSEMQSLLDKISTVQDSLREGKPVDNKDIEKLITDFKDISKNLTKEDNPSGVISKSFYNPVKEGLQKISDLMDKNAAAAASAATSTDSTSTTTTTATSSNASGSSSSSESSSSSSGSSSNSSSTLATSGAAA